MATFIDGIAWHAGLRSAFASCSARRFERLEGEQRLVADREQHRVRRRPVLDVLTAGEAKRVAGIPRDRFAAPSAHSSAVQHVEHLGRRAPVNGDRRPGTQAQIAREQQRCGRGEIVGKVLSGLHAAQAQHKRVKGVHENGSYPRVLRYSNRAIDSVLEQGRPQVQSLRFAIDREPGRHHDRDRIGHIAAHANCCQLVRNSAGCHGVVATDVTVLIGDDKAVARSAQLFGQCSTLEPFVENGLAALEIIQSM